MKEHGHREPATGSRGAKDSGAPDPGSPLPAPLLYRLPMAVRWRDLDAFNHVNNASFLTYLEEARIRWFDSLDGPWLSDEFAPLLAAVQVNYRAPIAYPAEIAIELTAQRVGTTSLTVGHRILGHDGTPLHADGHVVMVWINRATERPRQLPDAILKAVKPSGKP